MNKKKIALIIVDILAIIAMIIIGFVRVNKTSLLNETQYGFNVDFEMQNEDQNVEPNETVTIDISVIDIFMGEDGLNAVIGNLEYDKSIFENAKVTVLNEKNIWNIQLSQANSDQETYCFYSMIEGTSENQKIARVELKVKENIKPQLTQIKLADIKSSTGEKEIQISDETLELKVDGYKGDILDFSKYDCLTTTIFIIIFVLAILNVLVFVKKKILKTILVIIAIILFILLFLVCKESFLYKAGQNRVSVIPIQENINIDYSGKEVVRVNPETSIKDLQEQYAKLGKTIIVYDENNNIVKDGILRPGMKVQVVEDGKEFYIAISGDYNNDGKVDITDFTNTIKDIVENEEVPVDGTNNSLDINGDGVINEDDIKDLAPIILNKENQTEDVFNDEDNNGNNSENIGNDNDGNNNGVNTGNDDDGNNNGVNTGNNNGNNNGGNTGNNNENNNGGNTGNDNDGKNNGGNTGNNNDGNNNGGNTGNDNDGNNNGGNTGNDNDGNNNGGNTGNDNDGNNNGGNTGNNNDGNNNGGNTGNDDENKDDEDSEVIEYTISYNLASGTIQGTNPTKYTEETESFTLVNPSKIGYTFAGWTGTDLDKATKTLTIEKGTTGNKEYIATWTPNKDTKYKVEHYIEELDGTYTLKETKEYEGTTLDKVTAKPETYEGFSENKVHQDRIAEGKIAPDGSLVLKLYYLRNQYDLTVKAGDGILSTTGTGKYKYQETVQITANLENKPGYTYSNFNWELDDESIIANKQELTTTVTISAEDIEITAKQDKKIITYKITYDLAEGKLEKENPVTYTVETEDFTLVNPEKVGYTFAGWTGTGLETATKIVTIVKGSTEDRTFVATWIANKDTEYKVEHYTENLDGTYKLEETETLEGETATNVIATAKGYEGFTENTTHEDRVATGTVTANGSLVLKLYYIRNEYDLTVTAGAYVTAVTGTGKYKYGQEVEITATLEKLDGYTYTDFGWETTTTVADKTATTTKVTIPAANTAVIAKQERTINEYTISYELNNGTVQGINPEKYTIETENFILVNPTRQGYTFTGWTGTGLDEASQTVTIEKGTTGNKEYTANWKANILTVNYYSNYATEAFADTLNAVSKDTNVLVKTFEVAYDAGVRENGLHDYTEETDSVYLAREGYTGTGNWGITPEGGITVHQSSSWESTEIFANIVGVSLLNGNASIDLYPIWKSNEDTEYKVEHYTENLDGTYTLRDYDPLAGKTATEVTAVAKGYTGFTENTEHADRIPTGIIAEDGSLVLKLYYTRNEYDLTVTAGQYVTAVTGTGKYKYEQEVEITATLEDLDGYTYTNFGWETTATVADKTATTTKVTIQATNTEVIAKQDRTVNEYTISYELNDGIVEGTNPEQYTVETEDITLINPTKVGYTFIGWTGTDLQESTMTVVIPKGTTGNKEYIAIWEGNKGTAYKVEHYKEELDGSYTLAEEEPLKGETATKAVAVAKIYEGFTENTEHEDRIAEGTIAPDGSLVLKLYYSRNEYKLTVTSGDNIESVTGNGTYKYGASIDVTATLENKDGYTYSNFRWESEEASIIANTKEVATKVTIPAKAVSIIAKQDRAVITYNITYDLQEGTTATENPETYTVETEDFTLVNPSKEGYTFAGWTGTQLDEATQTVTIEKGSIGNRTYTVTWETNKDTVYKVEHYQEGLDGVYNLKESKEYKGETLERVTATAQNYLGFTENTEHEDRVAEGTIAADGSLVLKLYYSRNTDIDYKVEHYREVLEGKYTLKETKEYKGITEAPVTAIVETYEGFTENTTHEDRVAEGIIAADGSLVLKLYYSRNEYTLTVVAGDNVTKVTGSGTYKYEEEIDITATKEKLDGYTYSNFRWETDNASILANVTELETTVTIPASDVTVTAKQDRTPITYNITYDLQEGTTAIENPTAYTVETEDITIVNPEKQGFTFTGWTGTDLESPTETVIITKGSLGDREYTATWTPNGDTKYTVEHYLEGLDGKYTLKDRIEHEGVTSEEIKATAKSYIGFTENTEHEDRVAEGKIAADGSLVLKLYYSRNEYELTVIAGDNIKSVTGTGKYKYQEEVEIIATKENLDGYTYSNFRWETEDASILVNTADVKTTVTIPASDVEITAKQDRQVITYNITYDLQEGTTATENPVTYTVETEDFTLVNPTKVGYTFAGWTGTDLEKATETVTVKKGCIGDRSFAATWETNKDTVYNVEHYIEGLDGIYALKETKEYKGETLEQVTAIAQDYIGFTENTTHQDRVAEGTIVPDGSLVLKLYYSRNTDIDYKVEHYIEGLDGVYTLKETKEYKGITEAGVTATAETYEGFTENTTHQDRVAEGTIVPNGSTVLKLYYSRNEYNLTVTAGQYVTAVTGTGKYKYEQEVEITATLEDFEGYTYTNFGWETTATVVDKTATTTKVTIPAANTEVVAKQDRTINEYTISYELNDGIVEGTNPEKYTVETEDFTLINPTRQGYTFTGWTGTGLDEASQTVTIEKETTGNKEYTANWKANILTVNYYSNYATEAFADTLNAVSKDTNVLVKTFEVAYDAGVRENGLHDYTEETDSVYLAREGYTGTGNWGTTPEGGITVHQSSSWESTEIFANIVGVSLLNGNASIDLYPIWKSNEDTAYKVEHYTENLDGTYTLRDYDPLAGKTATEVTAVAKGYTGFTENTEHADRISSGIIATDGSLVLKLYYTRNEYDLTVTAGQYVTTVTGTGKYKYEQEVEITSSLENLAGYTYSNFRWETEDTTILEDSSETTTKVKVPANNVEVIAKQDRTVNEYTISYELNDGTVEGINPDKYTVDFEDITLINPTKVGYTFTGWTGTDLQEATMTVVIPKGTIGNKEYTATWEANKDTAYKVEHYKEQLDGSYTIAEEEPLKGETATKVTAIAKTYIGFTENTEHEDRVAEGTIAPDGSLVLKLFYTRNTDTVYKVEHYTEGLDGVYTIKETKEYKGTTEAEVTAKVETYEGFAENTAHQDRVAEGTIAPDGSLVLKLYYSRNQYNLTVSAGANVTAVTGTGVYKYEETVQITATLENLPGYTYSNFRWESEDESIIADTKVSTTTVTISASDAEITAKQDREIITYNINYNLDGGILNTENPETYTVETEDFTLVNPAKVGYTFAGWTGTGLETATQTVTIVKGSTGNRDYTATWEANKDTTYKVEHYKEQLDGNYIIEDTTIYVENLTGETATQAVATPKAIEGFAENTTHEDRVATGTIAPDGSLVLKLYYSRNKYTLTVVAGDNVTEVTGSGLYKYEETIDITATKEQLDGYTYSNFIWETDDASILANTTELETIVTMPAVDTTVTAKQDRTPITYNITYDLQEGTLTTENLATYTVETEDITLVNPEKQGFTFTGWTGTDLESPTETVIITKGSLGDREFVATWAPNGDTEYKVEHYLEGLDGKYTLKETIPYTGVTLEKATAIAQTYIGFTEDTEHKDRVPEGTIAPDGSLVLKLYYSRNTNTVYNVEHYTEGLDGVYTLKETKEYKGTTEAEVTAKAETYEGFTENTEHQDRIATGIIAPAGSTVLKLYYSRNEYKLDLVAGDHVLEVTGAGTYKYEQQVQITANLENLEGYKYTNFAWETEDDSIIANTISATTTVTIPAEDVEITAKQDRETVTYNIIYNLNEGKVAEENPETYTIETEDFTLVKPTKEGYIFTGWTGTGLDQATKEVTIIKGSKGDREYTATWEAVVASTTIGNNTTNYLSIQDAIDSAEANEATVTLLYSGSRNEIITIAENQNITLDTNGKTLTSEDITVTNNGTLTLEGKGTIISTAMNAIKNNGTGNMYLTDITAQGESAKTAIWNYSTGLLKVSDATVKNTNTGCAIVNDLAGTLEITSGNISSISAPAVHNLATGTTKITDGTISSTSASAVYNHSTGEINVTGGTIIGETAGIFDNTSGKVTIEGGSITANSGAGIRIADSTLDISGENTVIKGTHGIYNTATGTINIEGGTIQATTSHGIRLDAGNLSVSGDNTLIEGVTRGITTTTGTTTITGGTIKASNGIGVRLEGGTLTLGTDEETPDVSTSTPTIIGTESGVTVVTGTFNFYDGIVKGATAISGTVTDRPDFYAVEIETEDNIQTAYLVEKVIATVNDGTTVTKYETLQEAVTAAETIDGATVTLLRDVTEDITVTSTCTATLNIDLGGFTVTGTGNSSQTFLVACGSNNSMKLNVNNGNIVSTTGSTLATTGGAGGQQFVLTGLTLKAEQGNVISQNGTRMTIDDCEIISNSTTVDYAIENINYVFTMKNSTLTSKTGGINCTLSTGFTIKNSEINAELVALSSGGTSGYGIENSKLVSENSATIVHTGSNSLVIKSGSTIISKTGNAIEISQLLVIGSDAEEINNAKPCIQGANYGIYSTGTTINFYNGIVKGKTAAISGSTTVRRDGYVIKNDTETIDGEVYQTMYLSEYVATAAVTVDGTTTTTSHITVQDAINTAKTVANSTVTLLKDVTEDINVTDASGPVNLDLGGYTLTGTDTSEQVIYYNISSNFILKNGTVKTNTARALNGKANSVLSLSEVTIESSADYTVYAASSILSITNSEIINNSTGDDNYALYTNSGTVQITGTTIDSKSGGIYKSSGGSNTITNVTINSENIGFYCSVTGGAFTMTDSTIISNSDYGAYFAATSGCGFNVSTGSKIISKSTHAIYANIQLGGITIGNSSADLSTELPVVQGEGYGIYFDSASVEQYSKVSLSNGIIKAKQGITNKVINANRTGYELKENTEEIDGKTYNTAYLIEKVIATVNDGTTTTKYAILQEAVDAAKVIAGSKVTLLSDVTEDILVEANTATGEFTIDLGAHTLTGTGNSDQTMSIISGFATTISNGTILAPTGNAFYGNATSANVSVTLSDVTLKAESGYAVLGTGYEVNLDGCTITSPSTTQDYAVKYTGTYLTITDSTITSTTGGIIKTSGGPFTLTDSTINAQNIAYYNTNAGCDTISNSTIISENDVAMKSTYANVPTLIYSGSIIKSNASNAIELTRTSSSAAPLVIGKNTDEFSATSPIIQGANYGLYFTDVSTVTSINVCNGILKGKTAATNGTPTSGRDGYGIKNDTETIDAEVYQTAYLSLPDEYTITYNLNGGTVETANPTTYTVLSADITLNNPTKEGYAFLGWTGSNGEEPQRDLVIAAGSTGNKTYTANWQQNYIEVSDVSNNKYSISTGLVTLNTNNVYLNVPGEQYAFILAGTDTVGLSVTTKDSNGTEIEKITLASGSTETKKIVTTADTAQVVLSGTGTVDITLVDGTDCEIVNTLPEYTAKFMLNDGTNTVYGTYTDTKYEYIYAPSTSPTRTGYVFNGWSTSTTATAGPGAGAICSTFTGNVTYYAIWQRNYIELVDISNPAYSYSTGTASVGGNSITFDVPGANYVFKITEGNTNYGTVVTLLDVDGNTITSKTVAAGTFTEEVSLTTTSATTQVVLSGGGTIEIYLKDGTACEIIENLPTLTATFMLNDGTDEVYATTTFKKWKGANTPTTSPTRTNYVFAGWTTSTTSSSTGGPSNGQALGAYSSDVTAYAIWLPTYTINYYNGTTLLGSSLHTYQRPQALKTMEALGGSKEGYTFAGWTTVTYATTVTYIDGQTINFSPAIAGDTISLYAIWQSTATFYSGTAKATTETVTQLYNSKGENYSLTTLTPATITGYTTLGWRADTTAGTKTYSSATDITASSTTYYAVYSRTANFYSGSSKASTVTATQYYNTNGAYKVTSPSTATAITGYTTLGWRDDTSAGAKEADLGGTFSSASANYYAVYSRTATFYSGASKADSETATQYYNSNNAYSVTTPSTATAVTNFTALGWRPDTTAAAQATDLGGVSTSSVATFYATYSRTVTFYSGATKATSATAPLYYNSNNAYKITTPSTATAITGFTTLGWRNDTTAGDKEVALGGSTTSTAITYYAAYSRSVNFYSGTSKAATATATQYYNSNNVYTVTSPSTATAITGFTTLGWRDDTTAGAQEADLGGVFASSSANYYATYSRNATFYSGVSKASGVTATQYYNSNNAYRVVSPSTATAITGFTTLGWRANTTAAAQQAALGGAFSTSTTSYYAVYSRTVNFYSGKSKAGSATGTQYYNSNNAYSVTTPSTGTAITSWTLSGWRDDTTAGAHETAVGSANTSSATNFYAIYSRTLTLVYNANGGTGTVANQTATQYYNSYNTITSPSFTLSANAFTYSGYTFSKWAAGSTSGTQYAAGASYPFAPAVGTTTVSTTMYAIWQSAATTITFSNGYNISGGGTTSGTSGGASSTATVPSGYTVYYELYASMSGTAGSGSASIQFDGTTKDSVSASTTLKSDSSSGSFKTTTTGELYITCGGGGPSSEQTNGTASGYRRWICKNN